jgi:hypothetical protein
MDPDEVGRERPMIDTTTEGKDPHDRSNGDRTDETLGAAIETLTVRDLAVDVEATHHSSVKVNLQDDSSDGRVSASIWATPERARGLADELVAAAALVEEDPRHD